MTNTLSKSGIAAHAGGVDVAALAPILDHERHRINRERLDNMGIELFTMASEEPRPGYAMMLSGAARELEALATHYSNLIKAHDKLRRDLKASLAIEEGK